MEENLNELLKEFGEFHAKVEKIPEKFRNLELGRSLHGAIGLSGEAGEVLELHKKFLWGKGVMDQDKLVHEMGDVFWYYYLIMAANNMTLEQILRANIVKLSDRYKDDLAKMEGVVQ